MKGISGTFRGLKFQAKFISYVAGDGKQIVKCMLEVSESAPYKGIRIHTNYKCTTLAKCNTDAGDVFSMEEGQKIALEKALGKFINTKFIFQTIYQRIGDRIKSSALDFQEKMDREIEKIVGTRNA
jgi:hypothetical protein